MSSDVSGTNELAEEPKMKGSRDINWVAVKTIVQGVACMCEPFQLITPPSGDQREGRETPGAAT